MRRKRRGFPRLTKPVRSRRRDSRPGRQPGDDSPTASLSRDEQRRTGRDHAGCRLGDGNPGYGSGRSCSGVFHRLKPTPWDGAGVAGLGRTRARPRTRAISPSSQVASYIEVGSFKDGAAPHSLERILETTRYLNVRGERVSAGVLRISPWASRNLASTMNRIPSGAAGKKLEAQITVSSAVQAMPRSSGGAM
jgi:hypothetical protein